MQITKEQEMQKICETLNTMGSVKIYSNDGNIETLRFKVKKPFATQIGTDFAVDSLRKLGFSNVQNNPEKSFYNSVSATIICEYDLATKQIKKANPNDLVALLYIFNYAKNWCTIFLPTPMGREQISFYKHKSDIKNYLRQHHQK